jgi:predicted TIM-barrel fold metal-dependent hydrolase
LRELPRLRNNLYIAASGMVLPHYLERAASAVGTERPLFSTDLPYQYRPGRDARRFLETCGLDEYVTADCAHGNWSRLTRA